MHAYNSISAFETLIDDYIERINNLPFGLEPKASIKGLVFIGDCLPEEVSSIVPHYEQLVLVRVHLGSPGVWEFLGTLNPLEVIRQYLKDGHERRKDLAYRNNAEARRLYLENLERETKVFRERVQLAKDLGATERELTPMRNELIYGPLTRLDLYQDRGDLRSRINSPLGRKSLLCQ